MGNKIGVINAFPKRIGKIETKKLGFLMLLGYAGLNVILLLQMLFLCLENNENDAPLFDVVITSSGKNKFLTIKALRMAIDLGLEDAKNLVESAPSKVAEGVSRAVAGRIEKYLTDSGATVEITELDKPEEPTVAE